MADEAHSLFSASGAAGWSVCYGKPALEAGRKKSSSYADEGTAAHELASRVMQDRIDGGSATAAKWKGDKITVKRDDGPARVFTVGPEMIENVDAYVDAFFAISQGRDVIRFCEKRVHYHEYLGVEKAMAWGTSDGIAVVFNAGPLEWEDSNGIGHMFGPGDELQVHDLKYGKGYQVDAEQNAQLRLYALGTLWEYGHLGNITRVRMCIHQPRKEHFSEEVISVTELETWSRKLKAAAPHVTYAKSFVEKGRKEGRPDLEISQELFLNGNQAESEKGCAFCDAAGICAAKIGTVSEAVSGRRLTADDFEDLTVDARPAIREYGGNYLAHAYTQLDAVEAWIKGVRAEIDYRVLVKGEKIQGVKVAAGKKGARAWKDADEAHMFVQSKIPAAVRAAMYEEKLRTPAQLEKALGKSHPAYWILIQELITQAEGKPSVVPESSPRPAISHQARREQFDDLTLEQSEPETGASSEPERHPFRG